MLLQLVWPRKDEILHCDLLTDEQNRLYFCFKSGEFVTQPPTTVQGYLEIALRQLNVVIGVVSEEFKCLINGQPLKAPQTCNLVEGMQIQAGHYLFTVLQAPQSEQPLSEKQNIPELSELLGYGGYYSTWNTSTEFGETEEDVDALKKLNYEYNRHLIWGNYETSPPKIAEKRNIQVIENEDYLEKVVEQVKSKTVSECIIDGREYIDTILDSLPISELEKPGYFLDDDDNNEILSDEDIDILKLLAPEELLNIERKYLTDLTNNELKKTGLNSYL